MISIDHVKWPSLFHLRFVFTFPLDQQYLIYRPISDIIPLNCHNTLSLNGLSRPNQTLFHFTCFQYDFKEILKYQNELYRCQFTYSSDQPLI